jgi:hypothetical protein
MRPFNYICGLTKEMSFLAETTQYYKSVFLPYNMYDLKMKNIIILMALARTVVQSD